MQITRTRGDTIADVFTVTNTTTSDLANLTGCTFKLSLNTLQNPPDDSTQVYQIVGTIDVRNAGLVTFSPTTAQADQVGFFYFDVQMTDSYGKNFTLVKGTYVYTQDITK